MVNELLSYNSYDLDSLDAIIHELSPTSFCSKAKLYAVIKDPNSHLYIIREEQQIVAIATLCVIHTLEFTVGTVEAVVVASVCRGKGYGKLLMKHIYKEAKNYDCVKIHLTSNPRRVVANNLYQSLGFRQYETNYYELEIK